MLAVVSGGSGSCKKSAAPFGFASALLTPHFKSISFSVGYFLMCGGSLMKGSRTGVSSVTTPTFIWSPFV